MNEHKIEDLVYDLEERYADEDVMSIGLVEIYDMLTEFDNFDEGPSGIEDETLEKIHRAWIELRESK